MGGPRARVLVAGIGNVFFGDDGFGPSVVSLLQQGELPPGVDVVDYGIRGVHLAYELLNERYASLVLVDALPIDEPPGTLAVVEVDDQSRFGGQLDAHSMSPAVVLSALATLGAPPLRVLVVGCAPAALDSAMALSEPVKAALPDAAALVLDVAGSEAERLRADGLVGARE